MMRRPFVTILVGVQLSVAWPVDSAAASGAAARGKGETVKLTITRLPPEGFPVSGWAGRLRFRGGLVLASADPRFGGLSALRLVADGEQFLALTDRGDVVAGRLDHGAAGDLRGVTDVEIGPLPDLDGGPVAGRRRDAEALARLPGGAWVVGFERMHRLMRYPAGLGQGRPLQLAGPDGLDRLPENAGLEAVTDLPDGRLLLLAEVPADGDLHRGWIGRPGDWTPFRYHAAQRFRPVDAAVLPDGSVLVLERRATWFGGFSVRLVQVAGEAVSSLGPEGGGTLAGELLALLETPSVVDNFEGLGVRMTKDGRTLVYLVSDDNFRAAQRTLLLQLELLPD